MSRDQARNAMQRNVSFATSAQMSGLRKIKAPTRLSAEMTLETFFSRKALSYWFGSTRDGDQ